MISGIVSEESADFYEFLFSNSVDFHNLFAFNIFVLKLCVIFINFCVRI